MSEEKLLFFIIEDDRNFRVMLEKRLQKLFSNCSISSVDTLAKAKEILEAVPPHPFSLVILDEHLPDGRGKDFLASGVLSNYAVLSVSSDANPLVPGSVLEGGASFFLPKTSINEPLFAPLIKGILDRKKLVAELQAAKIRESQAETIRKLISTLKHEINNPLGAVLGAAYLVRAHPDAHPDMKEAARLVEESGKRIQHVIAELGKVVNVEEVSKSEHELFHIPGDKKWGA